MKEEYYNIFINSSCICLDVDSTIILEEGIETLAKNSIHRSHDLINISTEASMNGDSSFESSLQTQLSFVRPNKTLVERSKYMYTLTPGVKEFIIAMKDAGKCVFLISGGFKQMIEPIALSLGIPSENVFANVLLFDDDGEYLGIDYSQPTSKQYGKKEIVSMLREKYGRIVHIGDGVTDLDARADLFIGFGGVKVRPRVLEGADHYIHHFRELLFS